MTEEDVYQRFVVAVDAAGGQRGFGRKVGLDPSYINDIVHRRRRVSDRILEALGIERIVSTTVEYRERED